MSAHDPWGSPYEPQRPMAPGERRFLVGFCALLFGLMAVEVLRDFTPVKLSVVFFPVAWAALTALHEGGHALAARLCGWRITHVMIGFGRTLKRLRLGGVPVELRALPIIGYVSSRPNGGRRLRSAYAFICFAGPGVELLLVAVVVWVVGYDTLTTVADSPALVAAQTLCVAALMGAIINLVPHVGPDGSWSDGMGLFMSPFLTPGHFQQSEAAPLLAEAQARAADGDLEGALAVVEGALEGYPRAMQLQVMAAMLLVELGRRLEAMVRLQALSRDADLEPAERRAAELALERVRSLPARG